MKTYAIQIILMSCLTFFVACSSNNEIDTSLFPAKDAEGKLCYIDAKGNKIIELGEDITEASIFYEDRAMIQDYNMNYGFIDKKGNIVIEPKYKDATYFSDGLAWVVETDGYPIAIDKDGKTTIDMSKIRRVLPFNEGLAVVNITDEGYGMIDKKGNIVLMTEYSDLRSYSQKLIPFQKDYKLYGYADKEGNVKVEAQFKDAESFLENGYAIVTDEDQKKGVINKKGEFVIKPQFREILPDGNLFLVRTDDKFGWMDSNEKYIINPQYELALPFGKSNLALTMASSKGEAGFIDKKGKEAIAPQFQLAGSFIGNVAVVVMGNKYGFINKKGEITVNPTFAKIDVPISYNKLRVADSEQYIYTDYLDYESIIKNLLATYDEQSIRGFNGATTAKEVKAKFEPKISTRGSRSYITKDQITLSSDASIIEQIFGFNDSPTQNENATLTSVQIKLELSRQTSKLGNLISKIDEAIGGVNFDQYEMDRSGGYALINDKMTARTQVDNVGRNNKIIIDINFK